MLRGRVFLEDPFARSRARQQNSLCGPVEVPERRARAPVVLKDGIPSHAGEEWASRHRIDGDKVSRGGALVDNEGGLARNDGVQAEERGNTKLVSGTHG